MLITYTHHECAATIDDVEEITNAAVRHVTQLQGIIDSVETSAAHAPGGTIDVTVSVDYAPADPS